MVTHCGGSHGDDKETRVPSGSSSSSSASAGRGGGNGVAEQALKKGPWTAAEDAILIEYVKKHGEGNWNAVQRNTSLNRCGKSCRLRWTNHLRPNLKKGSFSPEEERLILQLHAQLGNKWARMATQLPGRTDNEIKNYWNTRIKRRIRQGLPLYPNGIAPQKQLASSLVQPELQAVPGAATRGRPPLQIPTRTISQVLAQSHSPNPTLSPVPLSPQSYNHLKTTFANSSYSTAPLSPSTGGLASPYSPTILSPTPILNRYSDPDAPFPGFSAAHQTSSPLTLPTASSFQFSPLNFNVNSLQGLQTPQQSPSTVYIPPKPMELPSNQLLSFQAEDLATVPKPELEIRSKPSTPPSSSIALLEDILEQAETLTSNKNLPGQSNLFNQQNDKFDFPSKSGYAWNAAVGSDFSCAGSGIVIKNEVRDEDNGQLVRLLQSIPSPANIPDELNHLGDNLNIPPLDLGLGEAATEDSLGLDMQQLALLFQADPASCPWNSMPKIL